MLREPLYYDLPYSGRYHVAEEDVAHLASRCKGRVLDIGCGDGRLSQYLDARYLGLEFTAAATELACHRNPGKPFVVRDVVRDRLPRGPWDTIILGELLDYLVSGDEVAVLEKVREAIASDGRLITGPRR